MRIISGKNRGRKIKVPENLPVRPTTDFAKTALFNILRHHFVFEKCKALDLFAGSGNITYELFSEGCEDVTAIDINENCIAFIKKTLLSLKASHVQVIKQDIFSFLKQTKIPYDIIFADPPFDMPTTGKLPALVLQNKLLRTGGWFVLEHSPKNDFSNLPGLKEVRRYGNIAFSIFSI